jgi:putative oxidoreductase
VQDFGKLLLRLTLGVLLLVHGVAKITGGIGPIETMLQNAGLPRTLAYGVYVGEVIAPLLVIVGWYARSGAVLIVLDMAFAVYLAHRSRLLAITPSGGWALELEAFYLLTALALAFLGPGRYGLNRR